MSHKKSKRNYVIYHLSQCGRDSKWYRSEYSKQGFIHRIAQNKVLGGDLLDSLVESMQDIRLDVVETRSYLGYTYYRYENKYYLCKETPTGTFRINIEDFAKDIEAESVKIRNKREKVRRSNEAEKRSNQFKFRNGAVPNIRCGRWVRGSYYRIPKLSSVRRASTDAEYKQYSKASENIKNLPVWDDRLRYTDRCWKSSCKVRKQWEKHQSRHIDTVMMETTDSNEDIEVDTEEIA